MKLKLTGLCIGLLMAGSVHAQMYKWVGPDGKITYSDTPPPKTATQIEKKNIGGSDAVDTANFPFELAEAVKTYPATLYTSTNCTPCDNARTYLTKRGIPFREKTVTTPEDLAKLREAGGDQNLPFLTLGRNKQSGFEAGAWDAALNAAGYPAANLLPKNYRNPAAEAAAPKPAPATDAAQAGGGKPGTRTTERSSPRPAESLPPATGKAPPGFRF